MVTQALEKAYDERARKRPANITINGDLLDKAKSFGINVSKIAEAALAMTVAEEHQRHLQRRIDATCEMINDFWEDGEHPADIHSEYLQE
jgi:post-segregation antitoxin (ccd killing protein)